MRAGDTRAADNQKGEPRAAATGLRAAGATGAAAAGGDHRVRHRQGRRIGNLSPNSKRMAERPEVAIQAILAGIRDMHQLNMQMADCLAIGGQGPAVERDQLGRTRSEARKDYLCFTRDRPMFERGRDCWNDFAIGFQGAMRDHGVTEEQAKWVLYNAIVGQSSRLVISSMNPELTAIQHMDFREYLRRMGEKFTPATESIQMEAEYCSRKQGKNEDVQN